MKENSYIAIDLDAVHKNLDILKGTSQKNIMAIIKANGYGMVDHIIASSLWSYGVRSFGVSSILEAVSLRRHGIAGDILVLGYVDHSDLKTAKENDIAIATISKDYVTDIDKDILSGLKVHLAIDTGMHRIGLLSDEVEEVLVYLLKNEALVEGIFTHYAKSDDDMAFTKLQYERFKEIYQRLDYVFKYVHTANTDAALNFKDEISNFARCGIGLLGYCSDESMLAPSVSLHTTVTNCRLVKSGEGIGYGQTYHLQNDTYIMTLAIGYADGILRKNKGRSVFIDGEYLPIVGNICMDQMMIAGTHPLKPGSDVEIFGENISLYDMAKDLDTIPYEILTMLSDRLERRYIKDGKVIMTYDPRFL